MVQKRGQSNGRSHNMDVATEMDAEGRHQARPVPVSRVCADI